MVSKLIIDFKPHSPKHGDLFGGKDPVEVAKQLEEKGVFGISVVTARRYFGGSMRLLRKLRAAVNLPVLRKDFITSERQLIQTKQAGATHVLLITAIIPNLKFMHSRALELGLSPVVEVHTEAEMQRAADVGAAIIGINNRDIVNLEMDNGGVERTIRLAKLAPKDAFIISESGINSNGDVKAALAAGASAVLIGTAFWQGRIVF